MACPFCDSRQYHDILRQVPGSPVRYDLRCPSCEHVFTARYPVSLWRWLKRHYRLTGIELRHCQRLAFDLDYRAAHDASQYLRGDTLTDFEEA